MQKRERKRRKWQTAPNPGSTPRPMCAVECDGLCGGERACGGLRRRGAEGESGIRGRSSGLIMTARPWQRLLDTAASAPSPGRRPYCRTGSCSGRSSPPVCPREETLHCRGNPESPVLTHTHTHAPVGTFVYYLWYCNIFHFVRSNADNLYRCSVLYFEHAMVTPIQKYQRNTEKQTGNY